MARTALNQLQDQIEAVQREAFAAGYAAAMQSIRELAAKPAPGAELAAGAPRRGRPRAAPPARSARSARSAPATRQRRGRAAAGAAPRARRASSQRPQRGTNARLVE